MQNIVAIGIMFAAIVFGNVMEVAPKPDMKIVMDNITFDYSPEYFHNMSATLNRSTNLVYCTYFLKRDLIAPILGHLQLFKQEKKKGFEPFFINITVDVCKMFKYSNSSTTLKGLVNSYFKSMNIPLRCPISQGVYYMKDFGNFEEFFPPYMPKTNYKFTVITYQKEQDKKKIAFTFQVFARVISRKRTG